MEKNSKDQKIKPEPEKLPEKEYFTVKVEVLAPVTMTYRILAESPEQALEMAVKQAGQKQYAPPIIAYGRIKTVMGKVYTSGTTILRFLKNF